MSWHNDTTIPFYEDFEAIPERAFMQPTADMDMYVFKIKPVENWTPFSFSYGGAKVFIRYRLSQDMIELTIFIPADNPDLYSEEDKAFDQYRCSLWLCSLEEINDYSHPPAKSEKFSIFSDFETSLIKEKIDNPHLGFYQSNWDA